MLLNEALAEMCIESSAIRISFINPTAKSSER